MNRLQESVLKDIELGEKGWNRILEMASRSQIFTKAVREGLYSDVAGALGAMHDRIIACAIANAIAREIIAVIPTKNALERFPKEFVAYAWVTGEAPPPDTGARMETTDIKANLELASRKSWSQSYAEDANWDVLAWQTDGIGRAIAKLETQKVIAAYNGIANASLATGAEITITDGTPTWAQICDLIAAVEREDFHPKVVAMNPHEFGGLRKLTEFTSSLYNDPGNLRKGVVTHTALDVTFVRSSLITKSLCIDTEVAAAMLLRRDLITEPYEDPANLKVGVVGSERIGVDILRTKAVARGTN